MALDEDRILTADEAAKFLKISRKTLYKLAAAGGLRGRKVGRGWRFIKRELLQYLSGQPRKKRRGK